MEYFFIIALLTFFITVIGLVIIGLAIITGRQGRSRDGPVGPSDTAPVNWLNEENIRRLLMNRARRLQKLKEQQAKFGDHTPPQILTEIEDIETEIEQLQTLLTIISGLAPLIVGSGRQRRGRDGI